MHPAGVQGANAWLPDHQAADILNMETVDVFLHRDGLEHFGLRYLGGKRKLNEDAVDAGSTLSARISPTRLTRRRYRDFDQFRLDAGVSACLELVAHVNAGGWVVAHQDDTEPGRRPRADKVTARCFNSVRSRADSAMPSMICALM